MQNNSIIKNPYKAEYVEETGMNSLELLLEFTLPGFSTLNGLFWDRRITREKGISFKTKYLSTLREYLAADLLKLGLYTSIATLYINS